MGRSYRFGIPASKADLSKVLIELKCCRAHPHLAPRPPSNHQHQIRRGSSRPRGEGDAAPSPGRRRAHTAARAWPRRRRAITSCTSMTSPPTRSARCWRPPRRRGTSPPCFQKPRQHCRHSSLLTLTGSPHPSAFLDQRYGADLAGTPMPEGGRNTAVRPLLPSCETKSHAHVSCAEC